VTFKSFVIQTALAAGMAATTLAQPVAYSRPAAPRVRALDLELGGLTFAQQAGRTRGSSGRIVGQIAGGAVGAAVVGVLAFLALDNPEGSDRRVSGDAGYTPNANTAYALGSFVGSTAAVYLIGRGDGSRASIGATALGTGVATVPLLFGRHEPYLPLIGIVLVAPAQGILGTVGYQVTRSNGG
jgi:hypothetical protein